MTNKQKLFEATYRYGKAVYKGQITKQGAVDTLFSDYGIHRHSAEDYLKIYEFMMVGGRIQKTNKVKAAEYYLENILLNYGSMKLEIALRAMINNVNHIEIPEQKTIHSKYMAVLNTVQASMRSL